MGHQDYGNSSAATEELVDKICTYLKSLTAYQKLKKGDARHDAAVDYLISHMDIINFDDYKGMTTWLESLGKDGENIRNGEFTWRERRNAADKYARQCKGAGVKVKHHVLEGDMASMKVQRQKRHVAALQGDGSSLDARFNQYDHTIARHAPAPQPTEFHDCTFIINVHMDKEGTTQPLEIDAVDADSETSDQKDHAVSGKATENPEINKGKKQAQGNKANSQGNKAIPQSKKAIPQSKKAIPKGKTADARSKKTDHQGNKENLQDKGAHFKAENKVAQAQEA